MAQDPTTIAFRFGYGLPLPEGAAKDVGAMLTDLGAPDLMAQRHPGMGFAAALPLLRDVEATRKLQKNDPAKKPQYREAIRLSDRAALGAAKASFARALAARASENLIWAATRAETQREGVGLVLASAEFNSR